MSENVFRQESLADPLRRALVTGSRGAVVWFTGLSGSGKSTVAARVEKALIDSGKAAYLLDGDNLRRGLCAGLGFTEEGRGENIRRIYETAALFEDAGIICLVSAISPYESARRAAKERCRRFMTVYVKASAETCAARDTKGLYARAMRGEIENFTGISAPYEVPPNPDLVIDTETQSVDECVKKVLGAVAALLGKE